MAGIGAHSLEDTIHTIQVIGGPATGILQVGITVHSICTQFSGVRGTMGFREHGPSIRGTC